MLLLGLSLTMELLVNYNMKVLFCQISTKLLNTKKRNYSSIYYNTWYEQHKEDGYVKPEHFWEIPLWIAEVSYCVESKELHIIEDIQQSAEYINNSDADIVLFSVLDVNKPIIEKLCYEINKPICLGGYSKLENEKVKWFNSVPELCQHFNIPYRKGTDYSLFKNIECIPRLQLSRGCLHKCKFCTIPKGIEENNFLEIKQQVYSIRNMLKFKLVYIDDKTFGQASNYPILKWVYRKIKQVNPEFKGFIVQTTASKLLDICLEEHFTKLHLFAVELGVESYNNSILKDMKKPATENSIQRAVDVLRLYNINVILNLIVGLPNETRETYLHTLEFINGVKPYGMNIYNLALYKDSELSKELNIEDADENKVIKSYHTLSQNRLNKWFNDTLFLIGLDNIFYNNDTV